MAESGRGTGSSARGERSAERVLVLGSGPLARMLVEAVGACSPNRFTVVGVVEERDAASSPARRRPVAGTLGDLRRILERSRPERIVVALEDRTRRLPILHLFEARARGIAVEAGTRFYERVTGKIAIESVHPDEILFLPHPSWARAASSVARWSSLLLGAGALLVLGPVYGLVALAIVLDSGRPVHFVQERVGLRGSTFRLLKFRTMRPCDRPSSEWARDNDHRITRVGRFLRRFRLDELPQLLNVLKGEMNLVGPRPHPASNYELLATVARNVSRSGIEVPYYALRTSVPPGITGWAQVRYGYANGVEEELEKLRYDLYYVEHRSLALDLRILFDTFRVVASGRGLGVGRDHGPSGRRRGPATASPHRAA